MERVEKIEKIKCSPNFGLTNFTKSDIIFVEEERWNMKKIEIQKGDIVCLNQHKLIYGDSTESDSYYQLLEKQEVDLVVTDPPYNVSYVGKTKEKKRIMNDKMLKEQFEHFLYAAFSNVHDYLKEGRPYYAFMASLSIRELHNALERNDLYVSNFLIWVKNHFVLSRTDYKMKHEMVVYGWKKGNAHVFYGAKNESSILSYKRPTRNKYHPTEKPIDLLRHLINNSSQENDKVLDPFLGSGSTFIACEYENRIGYGIELDKQYVIATINRFLYYFPHAKIKVIRNNEERYLEV